MAPRSEDAGRGNRETGNGKAGRESRWCWSPPAAYVTTEFTKEVDRVAYLTTNITTNITTMEDNPHTQGKCHLGRYRRGPIRDSRFFAVVMFVVMFTVRFARHGGRHEDDHQAWCRRGRQRCRAPALRDGWGTGVTVARLPTFLTVSEVAEQAHLSEWTIRQEITAGHLRARRIGRCLRVLDEEVARWMRDGPQGVSG